MFLAKHALSDGSPDPEDGTHATYHREVLDTLRAIGLNVTAANSFASLYSAPHIDFLITLYNRAGFRNSEMLAPLLGEMHGLPYLGGTPMIRGLTDDKHFTKRVVMSLGVRTPEWKYYAIGGLDLNPPSFAADAFIVKPNASSASWGIRITGSWAAAWQHVQMLHQQGHDAIVERYIDGDDVATPVVGSISPWFLPTIRYAGHAGPIRTYEQKRDLVPSQTSHEFLTDKELLAAIEAYSRDIVNEFWPFDHGRLEFRIERGSGAVYFIELNVNCNLWSRKTIASVAAQIGVPHQDLLETVLCHSLSRQGVISRHAEMAA